MKQTLLTGLILFTLLFPGTGLLAKTPDKNQAPEGLTTDQWQQIQEHIIKDQYRILATGTPDTYHAENRAHGITARFDKQGFSARMTRDNTSHTFSLTPCKVGYGTGLLSLETVSGLKVRENRIDLARGDSFIEWHVNGPDGLRQNFTLNRPPVTASESAGPLTLYLALQGDLSAAAGTSPGTIVLTDKRGRNVMTYGGLHVFDTRGTTLPATMKTAPSGGLIIEVNDRNARYPLTIDPLMARFEIKRTATDGAEDDYFGNSVSISGDILVVGAYADDDNGNYSGSAYIFSRDQGGPNNWGQVKKITAADGAAGDWFGYSVSISGDTLVVGAYWDDDKGSASGSAYIFSRDQGGADNWGQVKKITAADGAAGDWFGYSVSISGDALVVGAYGDDDNGFISGSAYIFSRNEGGANNWGQVTKITAADGAKFDFFGVSVSISGDTLVVGARWDDDKGTSSGSAYIFSCDQDGPNNWGQVTKITATDGTNGDLFGNNVSISGDTLVVGAFLDDDKGRASGSAYIFSRDQGGTNNWGQVKKITAADGATGDNFGYSVSISEDTLVVGAYMDNDNGDNSGSAYLYQDWEVIGLPQAHTGNAARDTEISISYPWLLDPDTLISDRFLVHGGLSGGLNGTLSQDADTWIWTPDNTFFPGETLTAAALSGIGFDDGSIRQHIGVVWKFTTAVQPSAAAFRQADGFTAEGAWAKGAALGDLDGDGDLDLVVANDNRADTIWLNNGNGGFEDTGQALGSWFSTGAALGDLDGDGDLDLICSYTGANTVWLNDGSATFTDTGQTLGGAETRSTALGDLDGDGDLDLVCADAGATTIWINNGSGVFTDTGMRIGNGNDYGISLGDMNSDGALDLVCANTGPNTVWLNADGLFYGNLQNIGDGISYDVAHGDIDADGDADLVFANAGADTVWLNNGTGVFIDSGQALGESRSHSVSMGDLDGDGDPDLYVASAFNDTVWLNDGSGNFSDSGQTLNKGYAVGSALGDLDNDGDLDALGVNLFEPHAVWINTALPEVTTGAMTDISDTSVTAAGTLSFLGDHSAASHGFVWNTTGGPTTADDILNLGTAAATGDYTSGLSGLLPNTTHYLRAYAQTAAGTAYGDEITFTTLELDTDKDGQPNSTDTDDDNDGVPDTEDAFPLDPAETTDTDNDGTGNNADTDDDNDGISDEIETAGTNSGDGNNDGTPDSLQARVATFTINETDSYVTLVSEPGTELSQCAFAANPSPDNAPDNITFDHGFFKFTVTGLTSASTTVTLHLPGDAAPDTYYKYGPTPDNPENHWYEFLHDGATGAEFSGHTVTLHFTDALRGDDILITDSMIIDIGAPGVTAEDPGGTNTNGTGNSGGCFISTLRY
ncbi:MAG: hypothetical protein HKM93_23545 [Desulfobacteraceae bacterium]|nr:hypothetical protein [Desulfobacteraceae bacterium]